MGDNVDDFVQELRMQILEETKKAYGETAYQRWQNPLHMGPMRDPDGYACLRGVCGDSMEIFLRFENNRVKEASFQTDGCGSSGVCGSFAAELSLGKSPSELLEITAEAIIERLGGLPEQDVQCASLASQCLQEALRVYMIKQNQKRTAE